MWIDIFIAVILLLCTIKGFRNGFVRTVIDTAGWFVSVISAYLFSSSVVDYVSKNTGMYENFTAKIQERISEQGISTLESIIEFMPQVIQDYLYRGIDTVSADIAMSLTAVVFRIAAFTFVVFATKIVFKLLVLLFSKKQQGGFVGAVDGITGGLTGLIKGLVISYILLALLVPLSVSSGDTIIAEMLDKSFAAQYLYDYNILLMIISRFI